MRAPWLSTAAATALLLPTLTYANANDYGNLPADHILYGRSCSSIASSPPAKGRKEVRSTQDDPACTNGASTRACWSPQYSIDTDFDKQWPTTGKTRTYDWTISNVTCSPDGRTERYCSLVNGQYPGPVLEADWGDMVSVTIHNQLDVNGTSIHWHGVRQLNTNAMDGVNGITECPIAPGQSRTYTFQATQFGTSWYHSHHSSQYGDGILGPIVFNGPASANYDIDIGAIPVTDWYYTGSFAEEDLQNDAIQQVAVGPAPDTLLINGTNGVHGGSFGVFNFEPNKTHRLRFINTAVEDPIRVSIDQHQMQVITSDFVPIEPVFTDSVVLAIGQRYDVIVQANQDVDNYWLRAEVEEACSALPQDPAQSIIRYTGAPDSQPTSNSTATSLGTCTDPGRLAPIVPNDVGSSEDFKSQVKDLNISLYVPGATTNNGNVVVWTIDDKTIDVMWDDPTLLYVQEGNTSYPTTENIIELPTADIWTYWIVQDISAGQPWHPIHLHGHDFYVLGSGTGTFDVENGADSLTYDNPTRRDSANLPAAGWLALAFPTDNPGAWLFHCHISWHLAEGFGLQFLETKDQIKIPGDLGQQCSAWKDYYDTAEYKQEESGL